MPIYLSTSELNDGSKEMGCLYFNGTGLKEVYQQNKSALLPYQTAFTATPLIGMIDPSSSYDQTVGVAGWVPNGGTALFP